MSKQKKCRICKTPFSPWNTTEVVCSVHCAIKQVSKAKEKKARKRLKDGREKLKSRSDWLKDAQVAINKYVRLRDYYKPCVSCGVEYNSNKLGGLWDCGHYRSRGSASQLRFNLHNMAKQCVKCNRYLSSNHVEYRKELINRIGLDKVEVIESNNQSVKYGIDYLKRIKKIFSKKSRILQRRINNG